MKLADISEIELDDDPFRPHSLSFTKLHGNGNDFILVDEMNREQVAEGEKRRFAIALCHRHFGIGADGVLFLTNSSRADLGMRTHSAGWFRGRDVRQRHTLSGQVCLGHWIRGRVLRCGHPGRHNSCAGSRQGRLFLGQGEYGGAIVRPIFHTGLRPGRAYLRRYRRLQGVGGQYRCSSCRCFR